MPRISVILPVYNGECYLKQAIESILDQTYKDFELIIIDDCSNDKTAAIAQYYESKYSNIIYVRNDKNLKLPASLNKGFSLARGAYWTWTSCDNLYLPNALELLHNEFTSDPTLGLVYADMEIINEHGKSISYITAGPEEDLIFRNVIGACFLYQRTIAQQVGFYNESMFLCEDYDYWLRLALATKLKPLHVCLYQYRRHSNSLSHNHEKEIIAKGIGIQKKYYRFFVKTRKQAALFYAYLRARDIYNPFRQLYLLIIFYYNPFIFFKEILGLVIRRF